MKKCFTLFFFGLFSATASFAQQNNDQTNNQNIASLDRSVIAGHFEINRHNKVKKVIEHINVNYALYGVPFSNNIDLELSIADPAIFSVEVVDLSGQKFPASGWKAQSPGYLHKTQLDISQLRVGNYKLNIYWSESKEVLYSIPFEKNVGNK